MTTEMFKRWRANEFYQCPTIEDVLMCSLQKPHHNFTIKSGNTWYGAGILVVSKKLRMCVIQADDEVYPIHVNQSRSTKYNSLKHVQNVKEAAETYGWGEVVHPWVSTDENRFTTRGKFEKLKEEVFNAAMRGYDPVVHYIQLTTSNGRESLSPFHHKQLMKYIERDLKFRPAFDALADRLHAFAEKFARIQFPPYRLQLYTDKFQAAKIGAANRTDTIAEMRRTNGRRAA